MIDHTADCEILTTGVCTCRVTAPHPHPKAGTSRTVDTNPRVTWLGAHRYEHPLTCGVYTAPELNWAPYCTCHIKDLAAFAVHPAHNTPDPVPEVPTRPIRITEHYHPPPWVWVIIGAVPGFFAGATYAWFR